MMMCFETEAIDLFSFQKFKLSVLFEEVNGVAIGLPLLFVQAQTCVRFWSVFECQCHFTQMQNLLQQTFPTH